MSKASTPTAAYRWSVVSRVAAAALGGYALSSAATVLLALIWPAPKAQALLWATMLSFLVYTAAVIWAFYTRSASRAWMGMASGTALCTGLAWWLIRGAGA
ncbi:MAG: iron transporter [Comamonadaceae bacterium]|nr:iron transporter [Comamonadaceae bacterium]